VSIISTLPAIYRHCGSDYLGFDTGLICHGLGLDWSWSCCFWPWSWSWTLWSC